MSKTRLVLPSTVLDEVTKFLSDFEKALWEELLQRGYIKELKEGEEWEEPMNDNPKLPMIAYQMLADRFMK